MPLTLTLVFASKSLGRSLRFDYSLRLRLDALTHLLASEAVAHFLDISLQLQQLCTGWFKNRGYDDPVPGDFYTKEGLLVTDPLAAGTDVLYHVGPGQRFVYPGHDHEQISVEAGNNTYTLERLASGPILFKVKNFS